MKKSELLKTKELVRTVLLERPITRDNDMILYCWVAAYINSNIAAAPFWGVMMHHKDYNLPPFESVRRTRQKLQAECPELRASTDAQAQRALNEEVYREFARG